MPELHPERHDRRGHTGLSFRQALLLAEAIAVDNLAVSRAGHPTIQRMPHLMSRLMLRMDSWPWLRDRAMGLLLGWAPLLRPLACRSPGRAVYGRGPTAGRARAGIAAFGIRTRFIRNIRGILATLLILGAQLALAQNRSLKVLLKNQPRRDPLEIRRPAPRPRYLQAEKRRVSLQPGNGHSRGRDSGRRNHQPERQHGSRQTNA